MVLTSNFKARGVDFYPVRRLRGFGGTVSKRRPRLVNRTFFTQKPDNLGPDGETKAASLGKRSRIMQTLVRDHPLALDVSR